jgi:PAS domain S-box-containing protein
VQTETTKPAFWDRVLLKAVLLRFAIYFCATLIVLGAIFFYVNYHQFRSTVDNLQTQEDLRLQLATKVLGQDLRHVVVDLWTIAELDDLRVYSRTQSPSAKLRLESYFKTLARNEGLYDQIRYIDSNGQELIRVDYAQGRAVALPPEQLQDKSARYYFKEAMSLGPNQIFISRLDLNIEHGKVETPYKPMLRFVLPVRDRTGKRRGVLVLNYLADIIRQLYQQVMVNSWGQPMLVNPDGFWLKAPNREDEWGFEFGRHRTFAARFPAAWQRISSDDAGMVQTERGLFVFDSLYPAREAVANTGARFKVSESKWSDDTWKLISQVPLQRVQYSPIAAMSAHREVIILLVALSAILVFIIAHFRTRNMYFTQQLRNSRQRFRLLLDSVGEGIIGVDRQGNCSFANPAAARLLGYEDHYELLHRSVHSLVHSQCAHAAGDQDKACPVEVALREGDSFYSDNEYFIRPDGDCFQVEFRATPIDDGGETVGIVAAFVDITTRKRAEDVLQQSHDELEARVGERTRALQTTNLKLEKEIAERGRVQQALVQERNFASAVLSTVGALVVVLDNRGRIVQFNKACEQLTGYSFEEVEGRKPWDFLLLEEETKGVKAVFSRLSAGDIPSTYENSWATKTGQHRLIAWSNTVLTSGPRGDVDFIIATGLDITERKRAEAALRASEEQLRLVTDNLPVLIAYLDSDLRYRFNNQVYETWFGTAHRQLYGKHVSAVLGETAYLKVEDKMRQALSGMEVHFEAIMPYETAGGRYVSASYIPHKDPNGQVRGFFVLIQDITERKQAEERAREYQEEMTHLARVNMMGELATGLAHEINQPLAAIHSYAETALALQGASFGGSTDSIGAVLRKIRNQADRASKIVRRLRELVRKREVIRADVDANELVQEVVEFILPTLHRGGIALKLELESALPSVHADYVQLSQVLLNLMNNAIEAMLATESEPRELTIRSETQKSYLLLSVTDTGPGLDAQAMGEIFKPFVTTKGDAGLGMGLAISHSIVESHHGALWAESSPGNGSTFYIRLPIEGPGDGHAADQATNEDGVV